VGLEVKSLKPLPQTSVLKPQTETGGFNDRSKQEDFGGDFSNAQALQEGAFVGVQ
jgi:hypothetical protein